MSPDAGTIWTGGRGRGGVDLNILHNEDRCVDELMMSLWGFLIREDFYLILLWETGQVPFID